MDRLKYMLLWARANSVADVSKWSAEDVVGLFAMLPPPSLGYENWTVINAALLESFSPKPLVETLSDDEKARINEATVKALDKEMMTNASN